MLSDLLGRNVTAEELFERWLQEDFVRSWTRQSPEARKSRMKYVLQMAAELQEIRKVTIQATAFCEFAIEGVITGKIEDVRMWSKALTFPEESADLQYQERMALVFARFREICDEAMIVMTTFEMREKTDGKVS
jgi:hypothetical protein